MEMGLWGRESALKPKRILDTAEIKVIKEGNDK
jgi:hypothetical protein